MKELATWTIFCRHLLKFLAFNFFMICTKLLFKFLSLYSEIGIHVYWGCQTVLSLRMRKYVKTGIWSILFAWLQLWKLEMSMFMSPIYYAWHRSSAFPYLVWNKFKTKGRKMLILKVSRETKMTEENENANWQSH